MSESPMRPTDPVPRVPEIPARLTAPAPVIGAGVVAWVVATVVIELGGEQWQAARATGWAGIAVGVAGFVLFTAQRAAAQRGANGAQRGLVPPGVSER